jgi:hypothetical protein
MFCIGDCTRNGWLGYSEPCSRFGHAARIGYCEKNFQLTQFEPASRTVKPVHVGLHNKPS